VHGEGAVAELPFVKVAVRLVHVAVSSCKGGNVLLFVCWGCFNSVSSSTKEHDKHMHMAAD